MEPSSGRERGIGRIIGGMVATSFWGFLRRRLIAILVIVAVLVGVLFLITGATLPDDGEPIPVVAEDALAFARKVADSVGDAAGTKQVTITVTEGEVTSFLAIASVLSAQLKEAGGSGDLGELSDLGDEIPGGDLLSVEGWKELIESEDGLGTIFTRGLDLRITIRDPEVRFTADGEIVVRGTGRLAFLSIPARIVVVPNIVNDQLTFEVVEGQLGRLPLPGGIANLVADAIERALLAGHSVASVDEIEVNQGSLSFTGRLNR